MTRMTCRALAMMALGDFHFAKIEIEQRAVFINRGYTDDGEIDLELTNEIDGCFADDTAIRPRTTPPAMTTSIEGKTRKRLATLILLVMTINSLWSTRASPTASVVVPMLR